VQYDEAWPAEGSESAVQAVKADLSLTRKLNEGCRVNQQCRNTSIHSEEPDMHPQLEWWSIWTAVPLDDGSLPGTCPNPCRKKGKTCNTSTKELNDGLDLGQCQNAPFSLPIPVEGGTMAPLS
jgi:hypothetical protein